MCPSSDFLHQSVAARRIIERGKTRRLNLTPIHDQVNLQNHLRSSSVIPPPAATSGTTPATPACMQTACRQQHCEPLNARDPILRGRSSP